MTHHRKKRVLGGESIITSVKRNVKSKGADENAEGGFSQKAIGVLGGEYHRRRKKKCKICSAR